MTAREIVEACSHEPKVPNKKGTAACRSCWNLVRSANKTERKAWLAAQPRCSAPDCKSRAVYKVDGTLTCRLHGPYVNTSLWGKPAHARGSLFACINQLAEMDKGVVVLFDHKFSYGGIN